MSDDGWLHLEHDGIGGATRIPDHPDVLAWHEARGWRVVDPPDENARFVPNEPQINPEDTAEPFIELVHPAIQARHLWPNNPEALAGAADVGWVLPNKDGSIPKRGKAPATPSPSDADTAAATTTDRPADSAATDKKE